MTEVGFNHRHRLLPDAVMAEIVIFCQILWHQSLLELHSTLKKLGQKK